MISVYAQRIHGGRLLLWAATVAVLLLSAWHAAQWIRFHGSASLMNASVTAIVGAIFVWGGAVSRRDWLAQVRSVARLRRLTGAEEAFELSCAWERMCLSMYEAELTAVAFWAVDLPTETVRASHGRRGLADWDYDPGEVVGRSIHSFEQYDGREWPIVRRRVLADTSKSVTVLGDDYVTTYAATPVDEPDRVVAATIRFADAIDLRGAP